MTTFSDVRKLMRARQAPVKTMLPGTEGIPLCVRLLADKDVDAAKLGAFKFLQDEAKRLGVEPGVLLAVDPEIYEREKTRQILFRAFVETTEPEPGKERPLFFPSVAYLRELDTVMVQALLDLYLEHQETRTTERRLDEDAVRKLVGAVSTSENPLALVSLLDHVTLQTLVRELAARLATKDAEP